MKNIQFNASEKSGKRCIENKNISMDLFLQTAFSFSYAGKCEIFICKQRKKYCLIHQSVHIVEDIFMFSPNYHAKFLFDDLYYAILAFNRSVQIILSSMDWYNPDLFESNGIDYSEVYLK